MGNNSHPINGLMDSSLQNLRSLVDADTIIGEAITAPDGTIIIPVSKVSFGFVSGGSDIPSSKQPELFGGGAGGGVSMAPEVIDKLGALFQKKEKPAREAKTAGDDPQAGTEIHIDL